MRLCLIALIFQLSLFCHAQDFPDLGGLLDLSHPESVSDALFVLTNPKSGSHLLLYSIMKITKRPMRGRLGLESFYTDPACHHPENIMGCEIDFNKPTTYWGHEYQFLKNLNRNQNKLIYIHRNFKENLISCIMLGHDLMSLEKDRQAIEDALKSEIFNEGMIFKEYLLRLETFDRWDEKKRCLVRFEHLINQPEIFIPQVLSFIGDDSCFDAFISNYSHFKEELRSFYSQKGKNTGSESTLKYFSAYMASDVLEEVDDHVRAYYPYFWEKYLSDFAEVSTPSIKSL